MGHCSLNSIEIAWSGLKDYVRKNNTSFSMNSVDELVAKFIAGFGDKVGRGAIHHAEKLEVTYRAADKFLENAIEPQLVDDDSIVEVANFSDAADEST